MPKAVDAAARRELFVEVAADLIAAEGLEGASLRRVAAAAGCTTGAVTHYFDSREALLAAVLRRAHDAVRARMDRAPGAEGDPAARLRAVLLESLPLDTGRRREWLVWLAFWAASTSDPWLSDENRTRYRMWRDRIVQLLSSLSATPETVADLLVALIDGLGLELILRSDAQDPDAGSRAVERLDTFLAEFTGGAR